MIGVATMVVVAIFQVAPAGAQSTATLTTVSSETDFFSDNFKLTVCDGPTLPNLSMRINAKAELGRDYVPCDFNALMRQVQHIINIALALGALMSIFLFTYAGFIFIVNGDNPGKRSDATKIFKNVAIGFIIMLAAWNVVYELLSWLTGSSGFGALLGNP